MRYVLWGDGDSPHLLKWARALCAEGPAIWPGFELWAASSRGFHDGFDGLVPAARRLALHTTPRFEGGNFATLRCLPRFARWLRGVHADWVHAHYLSSHGTLAWLARRVFGVRARLLASAWGSDVLDSPSRNAALRWVLGCVLADAKLSTSDSEHMAARMRALGAAEVMTFPFGLESMPAEPGLKEPLLFFANRGLEALYEPQRVIDAFAAVQRIKPNARLVVANDGALRPILEAQVREHGLADAVRFTGRLDAATQALWYARARWYLSLPRSDSVSVSLIEAMAHGCLPIVSDLPANRELVRDDDNGLVLADGTLPAIRRLDALLARADTVAAANREWVASHALFAPAVRRFLSRVATL